MFVLNPDPYSLPAYRIGPFQTRDLSVNHRLPESDLIDDYFRARFGEREYIYTINGRKAINLALSHYELKAGDVVTILTTSNNFYISGCVTAEIEKFCSWSRKMEENTRVLFVNHEFGYPYKDIAELKAYNLPIIEDCAGTFFSQDSTDSVGNTGDFVIYSFPKMFPLQIGGILLNNLGHKLDPGTGITGEELRHVKNVLSSSIGNRDSIINQRLDNYRYLREKFANLGFQERFGLEEKIVPAVFMFSTKGRQIDLPELKKYFYAHGVQCSVFYGEEAFFIPAHQALSRDDMDFFYEIMKSFLNKA